MSSCRFLLLIAVVGIGCTAGRTVGVDVSTSCTSAVELDAVAGAGDAIAFAAAAARAIRRDTGRTGGVGAARGRERRHIGVGIRVDLGVCIFLEGGVAEALGEFVD